MSETIQTIRQFLETYLSVNSSDFIMDLLMILFIGVVAVLVFFLAKYLLYGVEIIIAKTPTPWDDNLLNKRFMRSLAQLAPALAVNAMLPSLFIESERTHHWVSVLTSFYILWAVIYMLCVFTSNLFSAFSQSTRLRKYAVKGIFQMVQLVLILIGIVVGLSILVGQEPTAILTAIGASAAVLMLVFKDTIMGLVASVQLSANDMLHDGDWIIADSANINGEVEELNLTTVKVRNWDNSISTIPPYTLFSNSFRNYQDMREKGARLIDRAVLIDVSSIRFLTPQEVSALETGGYLEGIPEDVKKRAINVQLLRYALDHFLASDPRINHKELHMVRQLEGTHNGLPLQIYCYTPTVKWAPYEQVQSDIMDHVYALTRVFYLNIFQSPAGADFSAISTLANTAAPKR